MNAPFSLDNRMTIVLFAGMGGGCDGLEDAGFHVHVAINHDPVAVAVHEKRHPHTKHLRCDVFEADPRKVTSGRGVRALHASPDCTHFSVAKGSKPVSKRRRSLAWVICRWAGTVRPETITMENDDIAIRMLEPEEGAAAHAFKPGALPAEITIDGKTRRLTKTEKYHLVGNSVPPHMIKLLAQCNVRHAFAEAAE